MTFDSNPTLPGVADPYPVYRSVRESDPVHWCTGAGLWAVTRYADADAVLKDERFSRQGFLDGVEARMGHHVILEMQRHELVFTDNPRHGQLRALISEAITPQAVQALKPKIARPTKEMLDPLLARGRMDVIGDFARTLPTQVAAAWLGVPAEDRAQIVEWIFPLVAGRGVAREAQTTAAANQAAEAFFGYFRQLVSRRRVSPEEDLTTALLKAQRADGKGIFSEDDLLSLIVAVFGAGHGPGIATIANTWLALLRNPSELAWLKAHPELIAKAVEVGLRYDPPTQATNPLAATEDVELGGKTIHKGEVVSVIIGAANRDPETFSKPEQFDVTRHPNRHLSFSGGPHYCLGAALARTEAQIALGALVQRLDHTKLECAGAELRWIPHDRFRTLESLPISFEPS